MHENGQSRDGFFRRVGNKLLRFKTIVLASWTAATYLTGNTNNNIGIDMKLTTTERAFLTTLAAIAEKMLDGSKTKETGTNGKRTRRSSADVAKLQKQIRAARKKKVPVKSIAEELGVTTSYIYQIGK